MRMMETSISVRQHSFAKPCEGRAYRPLATIILIFNIFSVSHNNMLLKNFTKLLNYLNYYLIPFQKTAFGN